MYKFKAQIWRWPGVGGWHFVNVPNKLFAEIRKSAKPYGAGFVKVKVIIGRSSWTTALFPHKQSQGYLLSIKQSIRKKEGIWENDNVNISFEMVDKGFRKSKTK
ncbi:MAG: DUF1905 domain-containing protein [Minisyncoccia bacterium]